MSNGLSVVSDYLRQPAHAFIEVYAGGHFLQSKFTSTGEVNNAPEYILSLEYNKLDGGGNFVLTLFDKSWDELIGLLGQTSRQLKIRYGWVGGISSSLLYCEATTYSLDFKSNGVIISLCGIASTTSFSAIEAPSLGTESSSPDTVGGIETATSSASSSSTSSTTSSLLDTKLLTLDTETRNPTTAVKRIAAALGLAIGTYTETQDITSSTEDSICLVKEAPITYINNRLVPLAVTKDGKVSGFKFIVDVSTDPATSHFTPHSVSKVSEMAESVTQESSISSYSLPPASRTYIYQKGVNSSVVDFSIKINDVLGGSGFYSSVTESTVQTIDPTTKDVSASSTNTNEQTYTTEAEAYTHTPSDQSSILGASGLSASQANTYQRYFMTSGGGAIPYKGTLTIIGDPGLSIRDTVDIIVITSKGTMHPVSGNYLISDMISDAIQNGQFLTTLQVTRDSMEIGRELLQSSSSSNYYGDSSSSWGSTNSSSSSGEIIPAADIPASEYEQTIWNYLYSFIQNPYGVAGLMGNLYAESALKPTNLQNSYEKSLGMSDSSYTKAVDNGSYKKFSSDSAGYGLAQWTYSTRKKNLLDYAKSKSRSIGDLTTQLEFLRKELEEGYSSVLKTLKSAKSVREASDVVLTKFERPADQGTSVQKKRASFGQKYYDKYA